MKSLQMFPLAASREILNLPLGYEIKHVGHMHGMVRLYIMCDLSNRTHKVHVNMQDNSNFVPDGWDYAGTVEHSTGCTHVWVKNEHE